MLSSGHGAPKAAGKLVGNEGPAGQCSKDIYKCQGRNLQLDFAEKEGTLAKLGKCFHFSLEGQGTSWMALAQKEVEEGDLQERE